MLYLGKEYKFRFSVKVAMEVAKLCPEGKLQNIGKMFANSGSEKYFDFIAKLAKMMNRAFILNERFESGVPMKDWAPIEPISEEIIFNMEMPQLKELAAEVIAAYTKDSSPTQEIESTQKKRKIEEAQQG